MNILDYINEVKKVEKITVQHDGKEIDFYIKNLTVEETEDMDAEQAELLPIHNKQKAGKDLTKEEFKRMLSYNTDRAFHLLCDESGKALFTSKQEMKQRLRGRFFKVVTNAIADHNDVEEAEKN